MRPGRSESRVIDLARGRGSPGAGRRLPATLPTLGSSAGCRAGPAWAGRLRRAEDGVRGEGQDRETGPKQAALPARPSVWWMAAQGRRGSPTAATGWPRGSERRTPPDASGDPLRRAGPPAPASRAHGRTCGRWRIGIVEIRETPR